MKLLIGTLATVSLIACGQTPSSTNLRSSAPKTADAPPSTATSTHSDATIAKEDVQKSASTSQATGTLAITDSMTVCEPHSPCTVSPIPHLTALLTVDGKPYQTISTDAQGTTKFDLPGGTYQLAAATEDGYLCPNGTSGTATAFCTTIDVIITSGQVTELKLDYAALFP